MSANGRGRPLERDQWADAMWSELWKVKPDGLEPRELQSRAHLSSAQVHTGARYLREVWQDDREIPIVYVRSQRKWFIAPTWEEHAREAIRSEYLQQSTRRLKSAEQLLGMAELAFPAKARRIRKLMRNAAYLREEADDLVAELSD